MFTLIQILLNGWPSREERSAAGEITEILFEQRNKSYGAFRLRQNEGWYLLTALGLVVGIGGTLLLGSLWWLQSEAEVSKTITVREFRAPYCPIFPLTVPLPPTAALPNAYPHRKGEGQEKYPKEHFLPPVPSPDVPHYGFGIGHAQGDDLDGWLLPDLPGEDEVVPEVVRNLEGEIIPEATNCGLWADEEARPINLKEVAEMMEFRGMGCRVIEGMVIFRILVNKKGEYESHKILHTDHPILSEEVEKYIDKLRFVPCIEGGRPIKTWVNIPFRFKMID